MLVTDENFTITLYFKPPYSYPGLIISGLTFTGCVIYLLRDWRKRKQKNTASPANKPRPLPG
ncbi:MAG: hypothetical protein Q8O17_00480 [Candidatus Methanoperedens sp.]|nr:hypothetical protein [Candidatus Methanoperedens sp.]